MNAVRKRREKRGGEVWSCLYTQMRLLESGWVEIGHDQFHHLGGGGGVCKNLLPRVHMHIQRLTSCILLSLCRIPGGLLREQL